MSGGPTASGPLSPDTLKQLLKNSPSERLSRLLCPRRLDPNTAYYACLVPTYDVGRKAGLGEELTLADEQTLMLAWSSDGDADDRIRLPVYFHWEFQHGPRRRFRVARAAVGPAAAPGRRWRAADGCQQF
jgi:hypothetical protein